MMRHRCSFMFVACAALLLSLTGAALAQLETGPDGLGIPFESAAAGIALRPPADCKTIRRGVSADDIVEFVRDDKSWLLKVSRITFREPMALTAGKDAAGKPTQGLVELTLAEFQKGMRGAQVLRSDVVNISSAPVGMLALRYTQNAQRRLTQQAIIQANDQLYYLLTFTSPGAARNDDASDPREAEAVNMFRQVLDSVKLLDRGAIKKDQDERLIRTRTLLVSFSEKKLRDVLIPQQWMRLIRDGKDIGYTYVVEETDGKGALAGVKIGIRSRTMPQKGMQVDAESWLNCTFDRRHEEWSNAAVVGDGKEKKDYVSEFGSSDKRVINVKDDKAPKDPKDARQPALRPVEDYSLSVTTVSRAGNRPPMTQKLVPWYLPQAIGHLLPRLVPLREPQTYLFASYVSENDPPAVAARYIDVGTEEQVKIGGKLVPAIPIKDRVGYEGSVTTHYMSLEGQYLGSVNKDSKIMILPSDAATITRLWSNADLSRPNVPERPAAIDAKPQ